MKVVGMGGTTVALPIGMNRQEATRRPPLPPDREATTSQAADARKRELIRRLMASPQESQGTLLGRIEEAVCAYEIDFRAFLNGQRQQPPLELAAVLDSAFRQAVGAERSAVWRFAVQALHARFDVGRRLLTQRQARAENVLGNAASAA